MEDILKVLVFFGKLNLSGYHCYIQPDMFVMPTDGEKTEYFAQPELVFLTWHVWSELWKAGCAYVLT